MPSRSLADLKEPLYTLTNRWLDDCRAEGLDILVYNTLRTFAEQEALYKVGRTVKGEGVTAKRPLGRTVTNARGGLSSHQYGLGLDFVPLLAGKPQWADGNPLYMRAIALAEKRGLESLAKSSFPEWAHLQLPGWKGLANG